MDILLWLHGMASPFLDTVMMAVTNAGSEQAYIALLIITYLGFDALAGRRIAVFFLLSMTVNEQVKHYFNVARPFTVNPDVVRPEVADAIATAAGPSFPSGHAQAATTFWGTAALFVRRTWFTIVAAILVLFIGFTRMYLGVHYPADVVVGITIGLVIVIFAGVFQKTVIPGPKAVLLLLGLLVPLGLHFLFPSTNSGMFMGALAAFLVGPELVKYETKGQSVAGRIILSVFGVIIVFASLFLLRAVFPDDFRRGMFGSYVFYLLVGFIGTTLVPLLGRALGLVQFSEAR